MAAKASLTPAQPTREEIIESYLPYVKRVVHRIAVHLPQHVEVDDLIHVGVIGLIQALDRYDPTRDNSFLTYAIFRIKGAVLSELRSRDFLSRSNRKKVREMDQTFMAMENRFGRPPTAEELAHEMGVELDTFHDIKRMSSISFVSFEEMGVHSDDEKTTILNALMSGDGADALTMTRLKELQTGIAEAVENLPEKEKLVISLYYMDELTMKEAGKALNITESRVSQIHSQAIIRMRNHLRKQGLIDVS
ncbi:MAG: FliA/WhiG family RNA polymerase sigma factor [Pseudomonadota bacterium]